MQVVKLTGTNKSRTSILTFTSYLGVSVPELGILLLMNVAFVFYSLCCKRRISLNFPVALAIGSHLFPSRTQKLSLLAPMVLPW